MKQPRDEFEGEYEDEEQSSKEAKGENEVGLVQFRQLAVSQGLSCGLTLLGSHLLCWGQKWVMRRGLPTQAQVTRCYGVMNCLLCSRELIETVW